MTTRGRLVAVAVVVIVGLTGAGAGAAELAGRTGGSGARGAAQPSASPASPRQTTTEGAWPDAGPATDADAVLPIRLRIPSIGVDSALEELDIDAHQVLVPPRDPARAGWYVASAIPGELGPSVIAGHVDSKRGPAVFWRLRELGSGDRLSVTRSDGRTVSYRVVSVSRYPRDRFPSDAIYGPTPDTAMRLITCGGTYDHRAKHYRDNVVVFAIAV